MNRKLTHLDAETNGDVARLPLWSKVLLVAGLLGYGMGQTMLFAILPPASRELKLSEIEVGSIISVSALFFMISAPLWGRLSDRWGRKPVFVTALAGYALMTLAFALVLRSGYEGLLSRAALLAALIATRIAFALAVGGAQPAAAAAFADASPPEKRSAAVALVGVAFALGSVLGPALVAMLVSRGLLVPLYAISALVGLLAVAAHVALHETNPRGVRAQTERAGRLSPLDPRVFPILAMVFLAFLCIAMHQQTAGFFVQDRLGLSSIETAEMIGIGFVALGAAMVLSQGVIVQVLKPAPQTLMRVGYPLVAIAYVVLLQTDGLTVWIAGMGLAGAGFGLAQAGTNALGSLRVGPAEQGAVAGFLSAAPAMGFLIGPILGSAIYVQSQSYPFTLMGLIFAGLGAVAWLSRFDDRRRAR